VTNLLPLLNLFSSRPFETSEEIARTRGPSAESPHGRAGAGYPCPTAHVLRIPARRGQTARLRGPGPARPPARRRSNIYFPAGAGRARTMKVAHCCRSVGRTRSQQRPTPPHFAGGIHRSARFTRRVRLTSPFLDLLAPRPPLPVGCRRGSHPAQPARHDRRPTRGRHSTPVVAELSASRDCLVAALRYLPPFARSSFLPLPLSLSLLLSLSLPPPPAHRLPTAARRKVLRGSVPCRETAQREIDTKFKPARIVGRAMGEH
jgi:hypothetical protein